LPGHLAKGKPKRQSAATTLTESTGTDGGIVNAIGASLYHHGTVVNQDANAGHMVVEDQSVVGPLTTGMSSPRGTETSDSNHIVIEEDVVGSLAARDYKGVGNQYVAENKCVVEPYVKSSRAQTSEDSETWIPGEVNPTLNSFDVGDTRATTAIIEPVAYQSTPMLAFGIQGNVIGRQDQNGPAGKGHTEEGDPMFTLTSTDTHAVAVQYDGYNQRVNESDIDHSIRIGRDSSDFIAQPTEPTVFQPGTMVRLGGGVWEGTVPTLRAEAKRGDNEPHIQIHNGDPSMAVRRLTPLECERLMGWPDDHTRYKADGTEQADTHRYKQCGNGVASPVAQWIAKHILNI